jgi:hypothetical protein
MQWFFNSRVQVLALVALGAMWLGSTLLVLGFFDVHYP